MVRLKAKDNVNNSSTGTKEYLKYYENWYAKDWIGRKLMNSENIEVVYSKQETEKIIKYNENKGPEVTGYRKSGEKVIHYIPFSMEAVDKAIGDQDKSDITFVVKIGE